jgi:tRNA1(Val) A37 N6-methylase TrmN6
MRDWNMNCARSDDAPVTRDTILGGRLVLFQPARGHRAGTDAVLLAALVPSGMAGRIVDIGAGVGTAGLAAALRHHALSAVLLERDPLLARLARENIGANELGARASVAECDLFARDALRDAGLREESADVVLTNPPFLDAQRNRVSQEPLRRDAHVADRPLEDWIRAALALLRPGGRFAMIHRADALPSCLDAIGSRLGGLSLHFVHPRADAAATRLLVTGIKGSRAPLAIAPPLVLHEAEGRFTEIAEALHRGDAGLA